jgi:succinate-acetate transporter protein
LHRKASQGSTFFQNTKVPIGSICPKPVAPKPTQSLQGSPRKGRFSFRCCCISPQKASGGQTNKYINSQTSPFLPLLRLLWIYTRIHTTIPTNTLGNTFYLRSIYIQETLPITKPKAHLKPHQENNNNNNTTTKKKTKRKMEKLSTTHRHTNGTSRPLESPEPPLHHDDLNNNPIYDLSSDMDRDSALRKINTSGALSISPELFEKIYLSPANRVSGDLRKKFANPTPLAIGGFLIALTPLSCDLMGWRGAGGNGAASTGSFFFFGGLLMILGSIGEFILGNTFPMVVFGSFGAFWLSYAATLVPGYNAYGAYVGSSTGDLKGLETQGFQSSFGTSPFSFILSFLIILIIILTIPNLKFPEKSFTNIFLNSLLPSLHGPPLRAVHDPGPAHEPHLLPHLFNARPIIWLFGGCLLAIGPGSRGKCDIGKPPHLR